MKLNEYPVWAEGGTPASGEAGPLPTRVDLAVIGGGITGLAAARALALRGARVALLEARTAGWGASARNGGMVLTGLKLDAPALVARYGLERARRMFAASLDAIDCVAKIVAEEQIDCAFARTGHLVVAARPAHMRALAHEAEQLDRDFGHPTRLISRAALPEELATERYHGGLVDERSAAIDPARYVAGLARAAARAGALIFERTPALRVSGGGGEHIIETPRGSLRAASVLVATGGYTGAATAGLRRRIVPIGSYIIATEPLPASLAASLIPRARCVFDTRRFLYYFRLTPDGRMLFGGRAGFFPETRATVRQSAEILRRGMLAVFPQLRGARVTHAWGGTVDFTFDMMPHAGQADGLYYALGFAGHGVALATYLGTRLAERLAGADVDLPFEQPLPGAPLGLYDGRPWFLPLAGAWYKILDWVS